MTKYLLDHAIITWRDLKLGSNATAHLSPDVFKEPLNKIEEVINSELAKKAVNSLLGIWSIDYHYAYMVVTQHNDSSLPYQGQVLTRDAPGGMKDILYRQETIMASSMRAVVHQVLDRELMLVAQMRDLAASIVPYRSINQVRVDSLLFSLASGR